MVTTTYVGKLGELEYISLRNCYDLNKGYSTLFSRAVYSFDLMIIEHGYTYKELCNLWDKIFYKFIHSGLSLRESQIQGWLYFLKLKRDAGRRHIRLKRKTSPIEELTNYYDYIEAKTIIIHYMRSKQEFRKMRKNNKRKMIKNIVKRGD